MHSRDSSGKRVDMGTRKRGEGPSKEQNAEQRKKRNEEGERKKHMEWVASLKGRKVTCERQVCEHSLAENRYIGIIRDKGYCKGKIETVVGDVDIVVDPNIIAEYLDYERPLAESITYPRPGEEEVDMGLVYAEVFEGGVPGEAGGDLKDEYRTMNKFLHYNLFPRGMEKTPYEQELELLYVFMNENETMDFAKWIFDQLIQFKHDYKKGLNFPFPAMITKLWEDNGLDIRKERLDPSSPGIINATSENKRKTNGAKACEAKAKAQALAQAQAQ
ncbi:hypothetical protein RHMOL_Rhmol08G0123400 [Rhododendron molle]|uniref:Uncharacterized protein n=1 Tax=Rhododendron molle TaxID=49168 RepID=A0ACC0MNW0_RHOML|nr:hypothetical protein RHMOL_Rhmol08G0123400 [Rhododendron molle]